MIYLAIGRRERGKTTLLYSMARKFDRRIVLDARRMIQRADSEYVYAIDELSDAIDDLMTGQIAEVVYQPDEEDLDEMFLRFARIVKAAVREYPRTDLAVLVDEASFFDLETKPFQWLAKCTPRETVHLMISAHRPVDVPPSVRSIADHWLVFSTTEERDLKTIEERTSIAAVRVVRQLRERSFVHWDDTRGDMETVTRSDMWRVDMRPPQPAHRPEVVSLGETDRLPLKGEDV